MKTILTGICSAIVLCCMAAFMWTTEAHQQNNNKFWTEAAEGGMAEVMLGNLALQKAQSAQVKQYAQQMVTDHSSNNEELRSLATTKNVTLPSGMPGKHQ